MDFRDQFEIGADPAYAAAARARLRTAAARAGFSGILLDDFEVAFGEALSNAILHGSPCEDCHIEIRIVYSVRTRDFVVEIVDQGPGFDHRSVPHTSALDAVNGRGLKMMAALVDKAVLFHTGSGTTVRLTKHIPTVSVPEYSY